MGLFDFLLTREQKQNQAVTRIALESGLFVMCPVCHDVTEARNPQSFREKTQFLVRRMIDEKHPDTDLFDQSEEEILKALDRVANKLPYHCTCESI